MRRVKQPATKGRAEPAASTRRAKRPAGSGAGSISPVAFASNRERLDAMAAVAERFASWRPPAEVLVPVRAVPTCFPQIDEVTRVAGWPIERFALAHGPSNEGKTALAHGLGLSFLQRGHFYGLLDAERTTPATWVRKLMHDFAVHPGFRALRPGSYEEAVDAVRSFCETIGEAKAKGHLPSDTSGLVVVDSIRKLVPRKFMATIMEHGAQGAKSKGVDGASGRAAMIKAMLNAAWLDELIPLLADTGTAMLAITREAENPDAGAGSFGADDFKVSGGKALIFDSALVVRVTRGSWVREGSGEDSRIIGERHCVEVRKTKIGGKDSKRPRCHFHTSNGVLVPEGFDRPRDVIELALEHEIVTVNGSWFAWGDRRLGQGMNQAVRKLHAEPDLCGELEAECRAKFPKEGMNDADPTHK
jgi:recombination protein RecA